MGETHQILFEFKQVGNIIRVTAVDPITGIEAVIQGPASAGQAVLQQTAMKKLVYLIKKQQQADK